ncbi:MAG: hypothetical protein ABIR67_03135 [Gaiellaceae bacterium]
MADVLHHLLRQPPHDRSDEVRPGSVAPHLERRRRCSGDAVGPRALERLQRRLLQAVCPQLRCEPPRFPPRRPLVSGVEWERHERQAGKADARREEIEAEPVGEHPR